MAVQQNLHNRITESKLRAKYDALMAAGRYAEARAMFRHSQGIGAQVLDDARKADNISGDDEKFSPKPDPRY